VPPVGFPDAARASCARRERASIARRRRHDERAPESATFLVPPALPFFFRPRPAVPGAELETSVAEKNRSALICLARVLRQCVPPAGAPGAHQIFTKKPQHELLSPPADPTPRLLPRSAAGLLAGPPLLRGAPRRSPVVLQTSLSSSIRDPAYAPGPRILREVRPNANGSPARARAANGPGPRAGRRARPLS